MKTVTPERAVELVQSGAVLIDIRETAEHAGENIPGARHHALSQIDARHPVRTGDTVLIFHCKSGARTNMNAQRLAASASQCEVYILGGGIEAWKRAGLPTSARPAGKTESGATGCRILNRLSALFR
ncbi:MAG: rhodanese-like domain-containing protein [Pseudolabrys sp.]|nr:rhodanese-like domain-containing protein [Pseudolabrys sp.]